MDIETDLNRSSHCREIDRQRERKSDREMHFTTDSFTYTLLLFPPPGRGFFFQRAVTHTFYFPPPHRVKEGDWPEVFPVLLLLVLSARHDIAENPLFLLRELAEIGRLFHAGPIIRPPGCSLGGPGPAPRPQTVSGVGATADHRHGRHAKASDSRLPQAAPWSLRLYAYRVTWCAGAAGGGGGK